MSAARCLNPFRVAVVLAAVGAGAAACDREKRSFRVPPSAAETPAGVPVLDPIRPGDDTTTTRPGKPPANLSRLTNEPFKRQFPRNAQALSDGQTWFVAYNCAGCHFHGGGGIAPPLMDDKWFYGGQPQDVYQSIIEGRPNGMPSFRGRIPDYQVWEIVAYVRSLSGHSDKQAAPGRDDHMRTTLPPNSTSPEPINVVPDAMATAPPQG